jgi:hypothetical protein
LLTPSFEVVTLTYTVRQIKPLEDLAITGSSGIKQRIFTFNVLNRETSLFP